MLIYLHLELFFVVIAAVGEVWRFLRHNQVKVLAMPLLGYHGKLHSFGVC